MFIEDLIDRLATNGNYMFHAPINLYSINDINIVYSLSDQIQRGNFYTEKQQALAFNFVSKYVKELSAQLEYDVAIDLVSPQFKNPARKLNSIKSIKLISYGDTKRISVQFPFNRELIDSFKDYKKTVSTLDAGDIGWDADRNAWIFGYTESNILYLSKLLTKDFIMDEELIAVTRDIQNIEQNMDQYVPLVVYQNGKFSYKNVMNHVPQPDSNNLIEVLLHARSCGITCWDDSIELALSSADIRDPVKKFINNSAGTPIIINSTNLESIQDLLIFSKNILFVIPGGSELEHLKSVHNFLNEQGIFSNQLTVMFRLDSSSGKVCNEYIKEHHLNTPVSDITKFICVSGKIPKPLIESGKKFDLVIHFGTNSAHYTLKNYIKNHHNVISMNLDNKNKEMDFE